MMCRDHGSRALGGEVGQDGLGQGRPLVGIRARPKLIEQDQRCRRRLRQNLDDVAHMGAERGHGGLDALLISDVGVDGVVDRKLASFGCRYLQAGLVHERHQPDRLHGHGLAARVGTRDDKNPGLGAQGDRDGNGLSLQQRVPGFEQPHVLRRGGSGRPGRDATDRGAVSPLARMKSSRAVASIPR